ncbi:paraquat-inducible protein A [Fulvimonas soli]|jgi:paraquat-inducible protein A|uniref:Paraquat-inducible protein A n=1 Tax=Fulvimonas soli TaxID=155197 RepID=A0A316IGD9_9GAMM|nr:paraquat-inducible protein A [Fulvimonas soli]PWK92083.1 paraquat-inducible protein A [Fulvimonas soli]TNY26825.1 paraquat-inducible membrane protein A [Fulvimonas soli]
MTAIDTSLQICEDCDTVYRRRALARGEVARCVRCGAELERHHRLGVDALLALVLTAMIVFVQANIWPIVTLGLNGQQVSSRLWGVIATMWRDRAPVVAVLAAATLFFFPVLRMLLLGLVLVHARRGRRGPGFREAMVALHYLRPWTMSEVFVMGALVAIVKAHMYFEVTANAGIYAYGALMLLVTVFSGVDLRRLWDLTAEPAR